MKNEKKYKFQIFIHSWRGLQPLHNKKIQNDWLLLWIYSSNTLFMNIILTLPYAEGWRRNLILQGKYNSICKNLTTRVAQSVER